MDKLLPPKLIITAIATLYIFCFAGQSLAEESKPVPTSKDISEIKKDQAKKYREVGLEYQRSGNVAEALSYYQKAIAICPNYAVPYNDLGVLYEGMGSLGRAEESYLMSTKIDPLYCSAYTNLALLYEGQRDFDRAAYYWSKRVDVGSQDDPWTQKAANRLRDIRRSLSVKPFTDEREEDVLGLMKDIVENKSEIAKDQETLAQMHFKKARSCFDRGDMATAIKEALDAQQLDQDNPEIEAFIEKAELRALTR